MAFTVTKQGKVSFGRNASALMHMSGSNSRLIGQRKGIVVTVVLQDELNVYLAGASPQSQDAHHWLCEEKIDIEDISTPEASNLKKHYTRIFTQVQAFFQQVPVWKLRYVRITDQDPKPPC